jgi:hypothetical protein
MKREHVANEEGAIRAMMRSVHRVNAVWKLIQDVRPGSPGAESAMLMKRSLQIEFIKRWPRRVLVQVEAGVAGGTVLALQVVREHDNAVIGDIAHAPDTGELRQVLHDAGVAWAESQQDVED